jgi:hypothetical protein
MFALKVCLNDEEPVIAGAEDLGVLNAIVTCGGKLGHATQPHRPNETQDFNCQIGGLTSRGADAENEHLRWLQRWNLKVGDRVTIEIIETDHANPVVSRSPAKRRNAPEG